MRRRRSKREGKKEKKEEEMGGEKSLSFDSLWIHTVLEICFLSLRCIDD